MPTYRTLNNLVGWIVALFATILYLVTMEPTTSLWDCGEFIATAYKLQVGHPPGAPLFMMLARVVSLFAPSPEQVPLAINGLSALASGLTILFLFWSITYLARKMVCEGADEPSLGQQIAIVGAGLVGSVAYAVSDTFWFSAVEAEVYALSSLFTAVVFWAMLRWEGEADRPGSTRWILLIAYLMGLSIGVHLLNLLTIPALGLIFYFKRYRFSWKGFIAALAISGGILLVVLYGIIPGLPRVAGWFELLFVVGLGMPIHSGVAIFAALFLGSLIWGIYHSQTRGKPLLNTVLLSLALIIVGYSAYAMTVVRSASNPPIDENSPSDVFSLQSYLNREQYGDRPLFYGQQYTAPLLSIEDEKVWVREGDGYVQKTRQGKGQYESQFETIFPRMHSWQAAHAQQYRVWGGNSGRNIRSITGEQVFMPSFGANMRFFFSFQLHHMYWRYFMWNFAGRQDDTHNPSGDLLHGNWISGIPLLDNIMLGDRSELTDEMKAEAAYNRYYLLPLLLGILGLFAQFRRDPRGATVVGMLFILTGVAIVLYLNQTPLQPRERDYSFAGSFYAFAIWIGLAVVWAYRLLSKRMKSALGASAIATAALMIVPLQMLGQNYDDHDRSGRYTAHSLAYNYLMSCAPNAILFTVGDNDTFPLWYLQEVEGVRRDVRVCNLSLLGMDWYIDQMKRECYESAPLPISMPHEKYAQGNRDVLYVIPRTERVFPLDEVMRFVESDSPSTRYQAGDGAMLDYIPCKSLSLRSDSSAVIRTHTLTPALAKRADSLIEFTLPSSSLSKSSMIVLDILANNNWERPIYFSALQGDANLGLDKYMQFEGFAYRFVPLRTESPEPGVVGRVDADTLYRRLTEQFSWRGLGDSALFVSYDVKRQVGLTQVREQFTRLASALIAQGDTARAEKVVRQGLALLPHPTYAYDHLTLFQIEQLYTLGDSEAATNLLEGYLRSQLALTRYFATLRPGLAKSVAREADYARRIIAALYSIGVEKGGEATKTRLDALIGGPGANTQNAGGR